MTTVKEIPQTVAELRAKTGAGMMDCKKALEESGGDMAKAEDLLRVKYAARADKRADRAAGQGVIEIYLHFNGRVATMSSSIRDRLRRQYRGVPAARQGHRAARGVGQAARRARRGSAADVVERERRVYRRRSREKSRTR